MIKVEELRRLAATCRNFADTAADKETRDALLAEASEYDLRADERQRYLKLTRKGPSDLRTPTSRL